MLAKEIKAGEEYAYRQGQRGRPNRCLILDTEKTWVRRSGHWGFEGNEAQLDMFVCDQISGWRSNRVGMAAAIEGKEFIYTEFDPETGEPWTAAQLEENSWFSSRLGDTLMKVGERPRWVPVVVQPRQLVRTWTEQLELDAAEKVKREEAHRIFLIREAARLEAVKVDQAAARVRQEQDRARRAAADEFYEARVHPQMIELGVEHFRYSGSSEVTVSLEELARLLARLTD